MSRFSLGVALMAVWLLLWGSLSVANVAGGVAVIALLYVVFPSTRSFWPHHPSRPWGVIRLLGYMAKDVVVSTGVVALEIVTRRTRLRATIIELPLHVGGSTMVTLMAHLIALSPGTMAVNTVDEPPVITVHVLARGDDEAALASLYDLEARCVDAFSSRSERDAYRSARATGRFAR